MAGHGGDQGHRVPLGRAHWAGVAASAVGDRGARAYLRRRATQLPIVPCGDAAAPGDIDTVADLAGGG